MLATAASSTQKAAAFGAALTALALAETPASAAIAPLTLLPGAQPFQGAADAGSIIALTNTVTGGAGSFYQYNDTFGKSLNNGPGGFEWLQVSFGDPITASLAFGIFAIGTGVSGTRTYAFRTPANQVGWVQMNLGGPGGPITYLAAAWDNTPSSEGNPIGNIIAGTLNPVPEPTSLALAGIAALAVGAGYIRKRRQTQVTS